MLRAISTAERHVRCQLDSACLLAALRTAMAAVDKLVCRIESTLGPDAIPPAQYGALSELALDYSVLSTNVVWMLCDERWTRQLLDDMRACCTAIHDALRARAAPPRH